MHLYGLLIGIGIVIGIELFLKTYKKLSYLNIFFILIISLLFSRLLFVLHNVEEIKEGLINPFAIWDGGLAFYGGLVGVIISIILISWKKKIKFFELSDSILIYLPLMQAIGRIGNFFNYELYGKPTSLPWGIFIPSENRILGYSQYSFFHPVFAYEAILNLINFLLLLFLKKRNLRDGYITGIYFINYGIIRLLMNRIRVDGEYLFGIETSDLLSTIFISFGILILLTMINSSAIKKVIADIFSKFITLSLVFFAIISIFLNTYGSFELEITLAVFTFVIPVLSMIILKRLGITSDYNVTRREERPKLFFILLACFVISFFLAIKSNNTLLIGTYITILIPFTLGFLITLFWKISFHMIWSTLSIFFIIYTWGNPILYLLTLLLPFIAWSRVYLKRHTILQVSMGFILTSISILLVLLLLKF